MRIDTELAAAAAAVLRNKSMCAATYTLRDHPDATQASLSAAWSRIVPLLVERIHPDRLEAAIIAYFGPKPWDFREGDQRDIPAQTWRPAPHAPVRTPEYLIEHPGPNYNTLRVDFTERKNARGNAHLEFQIGSDPHSQRQLEDAAFAGLDPAPVLLYGRTIRAQARAQVSYTLPGDPPLELWPVVLGELEDADTPPLLFSVLRSHVAVDNQRFFVIGTFSL
jgi:hypothetical protein